MDNNEQYKIKTYNYLMSTYDNYNIYMWKNIPQKHITNLKLNDDFDDEYDFDENNKCDILMVNKENDEDAIIVWCKNKLKDNIISIEDLSEFCFLIGFSHIPIKGLIISNVLLCDMLRFSLLHTDKIKYIKLDYE